MSITLYSQCNSTVHTIDLLEERINKLEELVSGNNNTTNVTIKHKPITFKHVSQNKQFHINLNFRHIKGEITIL